MEIKQQSERVIHHFMIISDVSAIQILLLQLWEEKSYVTVY